jgi:hypothetical protein
MGLSIKDGIGKNLIHKEDDNETWWIEFGHKDHVEKHRSCMRN